MPKVTVMVGGSIGCAGRASSTCGDTSESATVALLMPCDGDDVASFGHIDGLLAEAAEGQDFGGAEVFDQRTVAAERFEAVARLQRAAFHATGQDAADERVAAQRGGQHAEGFVFLVEACSGAGT